jgi:low affinity Fe/Cu permease
MQKKRRNIFETVSNKITHWVGSSAAFGMAALAVVLWVVLGPVFNFSDTWQLVINTGTTIITFLMVFLIQKSQNKDSKAIQLKLNELIAASKLASNTMVDIESLDEDELDTLHKFYTLLAEKCKQEKDIHTSHSISAVNEVHERKSKANKD